MKGSFVRTFGMALGAAAMVLAGASLARAGDTVTVRMSAAPAARTAGSTPAVEFEHVGSAMRLSAVRLR